MEIRLLALSVGRPKLIGTVNGTPVRSGIAKSLVTAERVHVGTTNIDGDAQADLSVHGGVDKAVYAYPADNWSFWESKRIACRPNTFGENLTLEGADESAVAIGDRFRWGEVLLEISQPRGPCYKFAIHTGRADAPQIMMLSARCGWYFRVLEEGDAPVSGAHLVREKSSGEASVRDAFTAATHPRISRQARLRVLDAPALSDAWRESLRQRVSESSD